MGRPGLLFLSVALQCAEDNFLSLEEFPLTYQARISLYRTPKSHCESLVVAKTTQKIPSMSLQG